MRYKNFILTVDDSGIATFSVNRPEVRNALNDECWQEIGEFAKELDESPKIRVAIITGVGDKSFVAGADINILKNRTVNLALKGPAQQALTSLENVRKPVIAAVNGYAFGGGCELALACDIRIGSTNATFSLPELGLGIIPGAGGTQRLPRIIGQGRALDMILTGRRVKSEEALMMGLISQVTEPEELMDKAYELAKTLSEKSPFAMSLAKKVVRKATSLSLSDGLQEELYAYALLIESDDKKEGLDSFFEKRKPNFKSLEENEN
ncbi:enoyl-CoA hydratase/isomerase family protein [Fundicoccus culcitae]|uniref:Enoyl-CoA hydratase-related protein n=1 Tax=Fundicoccus culcitae TaxID=2969821 RepID=A0ABY5P8L5_9LACT|nr:enoyl-CoA hydratase-related protein [Fundicoccus culcitae]UUX34710.1 enoyl-CoA hydratase-related protein [Fundicoccus culcitae]